MFKLDLEKAEKPEIKLSTSVDHRESRRIPEEFLFPFHSKAFDLWLTKNCGKFFKRWELSDHLTCLLRNLYAIQEATFRTNKEE